MRILMLGWEFPPHITGGLGTACRGLVSAMDRVGAETTFLLPDATGGRRTSLHRASPPGIGSSRSARIAATLPAPYPQHERTPGSTRPHRRPRTTGPTERPFEPTVVEARGRHRIVATDVEGGYGGDLVERIDHYAARAVDAAETIDFDVVHAHDWMTWPAGLAIARASGRPLVAHVHATEFDRSGDAVDPVASAIERHGLVSADRVIAVSAYTRAIVSTRYGVPLDRISVVHNGIDGGPTRRPRSTGHPGRTVLFLGRITGQKGPEVFVDAAAMLARRHPRVRFLVAGWGDLGPAMIEHAAVRGLGSRMRFTGFLRGRDVDRAYRLADAYAMPSRSEPFGLTALEAARHGVPTVISRRSGVSEIMASGAVLTDPDDPEDLADRLAAVLRRAPLAATLREEGRAIVRRHPWDRAARACLSVHAETIRQHALGRP